MWSRRYPQFDKVGWVPSTWVINYSCCIPLLTCCIHLYSSDPEAHKIWPEATMLWRKGSTHAWMFISYPCYLEVAWWNKIIEWSWAFPLLVYPQHSSVWIFQMLLQDLWGLKLGFSFYFVCSLEVDSRTVASTKATCLKWPLIPHVLESSRVPHSVCRCLFLQMDFQS